MKESDYYPAGAYNDPNAPYNEKSFPEIEFDVEVIQTLRKNTVVTTDKYYQEFCDEDKRMYAVTDDTPWIDVYKDEHMTVLQLLEAFKGYLINELESVKNDAIVNKKDLTKKTKKLEYLIKECSGWEELEIDIE